MQFLENGKLPKIKPLLVTKLAILLLVVILGFLLNPGDPIFFVAVLGVTILELYFNEELVVGGFIIFFLFWTAIANTFMFAQQTEILVITLFVMIAIFALSQSTKAGYAYLYTLVREKAHLRERKEKNSRYKEKLKQLQPSYKDLNKQIMSEIQRSKQESTLTYLGKPFLFLLFIFTQAVFIALVFLVIVFPTLYISIMILVLFLLNLLRLHWLGLISVILLVLYPFYLVVFDTSFSFLIINSVILGGIYTIIMLKITTDRSILYFNGFMSQTLDLPFRIFYSDGNINFYLRLKRQSKNRTSYRYKKKRSGI